MTIAVWQILVFWVIYVLIRWAFKMNLKRKLMLWWTFQKMKRRARAARKAFPNGQPMATRLGAKPAEKLPEGAVMRLG